MRKALVTQDGTIVEVRDDTFEVHPDLQWIDVPDDTQAYRDTWDQTTRKVKKEAPIPQQPIQQIETITTNSLLNRIQRLEELLKTRGVLNTQDLNSVRRFNTDNQK